MPEIFENRIIIYKEKNIKTASDCANPYRDLKVGDAVESWRVGSSAVRFLRSKSSKIKNEIRYLGINWYRSHTGRLFKMYVYGVFNV